MKKPEVLIIGPKAQGGISSVLDLYKDFGLIDNKKVGFLASYKSNNALLRLIVFGLFLIEYIWILLTNNELRIIHIHSASEGSFYRKYFVFKLAKLFDKKVIYHIHCPGFCEVYKESPVFIQKRIEEVLNGSDLILVLSESWKKEISALCQNENIKILYNPCVIKDFEKIPTDKINVLFMGRIGKRKGVYDIIDSAKLITNPDIEINLYGDGDLKEFEKLIGENNLQTKVNLKGWIFGDKKDTAYKSADIYILPSYEEGLPMSVLEAMSYALPVISTHVGGTPDAVEDNVNGFLIQPGDYNTLAQKINLLSENKELREKMGRESLRIAKEKFDVNVIIKQLRQIYDELIK